MTGSPWRRGRSRPALSIEEENWSGGIGSSRTRCLNSEAVGGPWPEFWANFWMLTELRNRGNCCRSELNHGYADIPALQPSEVINAAIDNRDSRPGAPPG